MTLTHLDASGKARMVNVAHKAVTHRSAVAEGHIKMTEETFRLVVEHAGPKGDVLSTAELAGVGGAKKTADLIPLCHPLGLDHVKVESSLDKENNRVTMIATAEVTARTGVEMEALTAVSIALLTVYDMLKATGHKMTISGIRLLEKKGGSSGNWSAASSQELE